MSLRMPRSGWILLALVPAACGGGGGDPGPVGGGSVSSGAPAPVFDPGAAGSSRGTGGASGAPLEGAGSIGTPASGSSGGSGSSGSSGTPAGSGSSSGSPAGSGITSTPPPATTDAFTGAPPFVSKVGNSAHNPGQSCMKSGCHGPGGGETSFVIGGTVYKDYKGTIPAPGVEVRLVDAAGKALSTYSGSNGNFYISKGGSTVTLPIIVGVRDGTTTRPMVTPITGTMGTCAASGCHIVGGTPASGAYYPIHVP